MTRVRPGRNPLLNEIRKVNPMAQRDETVKQGFSIMYDEAMARTGDLHNAFRTENDVDEAVITSVTRQVVGGLIEDHNLLMNLANMNTPTEHLLTHTLGATILSIAAATAFGYDQRQVLDMGCCAYLHDIGMLRVPDAIVNKPGRLTTRENLEIQKHPIHSLNMLERLIDKRGELSSLIPIAAYQSHEREDGSGYPKKRKSGVIHDYAKLLAVSDTYQALISHRPWRQPLLPYQAMEQLVMMASKGQVASAAVRALLSYLSLFPIGSWVELSDKSTARVVASSGSDYTRPIVSVLFREGEPLNDSEKVNLAEERDLNVTRPIPSPNTGGDIMSGF
jgi:HD-GYP domain-containing protein (c-di-GMP phosphodiesterase class II)